MILKCINQVYSLGASLLSRVLGERVCGAPLYNGTLRRSVEACLFVFSVSVQRARGPLADTASPRCGGELNPRGETKTRINLL